MAADLAARSHVVLDTTTLVRSIPTKSPSHPIIKAFCEHRFVLVLSNEVLLEYEEILKKLGGTNTWRLFLELLEVDAGDVKYVDPSYRWNAIPDDPDDDKFVDAAVAGAAEWIVTDDSHFQVLFKDARLVVRPIHPRPFIVRYC